MKNIKNSLAILALAVSLVSCTMTRPFAVTNNSLGTKTGKSSTTCIFSNPQMAASYNSNVIANGICLNKKYGIVEATTNGKIQKVGAIDLKVTNLLFAYKYELIVAGE